MPFSPLHAVQPAYLPSRSPPTAQQQVFSLLAACSFLFPLCSTPRLRMHVSRAESALSSFWADEPRLVCLDTPAHALTKRLGVVR